MNRNNDFLNSIKNARHLAGIPSQIALQVSDCSPNRNLARPWKLLMRNHNFVIPTVTTQTFYKLTVFVVFAFTCIFLFLNNLCTSEVWKKLQQVFPFVHTYTLVINKHGFSYYQGVQSVQLCQGIQCTYFTPLNQGQFCNRLISH